MIRLAQRFACVTAMMTGWAVPALLAQTAPAAPASTVPTQAAILKATIRNFLPYAYQANRQNWGIVQDNRGILYFGNTSGVLEFDDTRWRLIKLPDGRGAFALGKAADGRILVGSEGEVGWLVPDASGSMVYVSKSDDLPDAFRSTGDPVIQILDTPIGQVFVADHWIFVRPANGALTVLRSGDHFLQAAWFNGALYVLDSGRGLTRLENGTLQNVAGGANMRGITMLVAGAGLLIPSYDEGMVLYTPGAATPWQTLHLSGWTVEDNADVTSAVALNNNLLALGTAKHGVALIDLHSGGLQRVGVAEGLADPHVYNLAYDHEGGLWLALDNGLSLLQLNLPKDSSAAPFNAWVRTVTGTRDERLLFGGTYFAVPSGVQQLMQDAAQILKFPYTYNAFRFDYSANGLQATGDMEFQTYMQGVDQGWTVWSTRSEREFTQLSAGTWVFRVRARKPDGEISGEGVYKFRIAPAWYNTWWFLVFQVFFVIGALLLPGHAHRYKFLQEALTTFAVIVPFIYLGNWLTGFINHYYNTDVGFVQVLVSATLACVLDPIQNYLKGHVHRRNERRRAKHLQKHGHHDPAHHLAEHHSTEHDGGEHHAAEHHGAEHHAAEHHVQEHHPAEHHAAEHHPAEHHVPEHHGAEHRTVEPAASEPEAVKPPAPEPDNVKPPESEPETAKLPFPD